ncbi:amidase [uncultured Tateyamaria sp.]|uniref:amidase n=1 Tax=uncultured Tateyamaria sp. TaxID=455651 RepID=UPI00261ED7A2|nr:amidase [uncultured Tateyamaria sp.]
MPRLRSMADAALCDLSAVAALELFAKRALSPVEMTQAVLARAEASQEGINAFAHLAPETALYMARASEDRYGGKGDAPRALEGICVALKDTGNLAGWPTSYGSLTSDRKPRQTTSPENDTMLRAGAALIGTTRTPEFSGALFTHSRAGGVTRNPHNRNLTPGGSSGGAAASLAIGAATLAVGSDIGGSIRVPASCCGVVGYKPPKGRNPVTPPFNLDYFCHTGPLARSLADTVLMQNAMCGPHPGDVTTLHPRLELSAKVKPLTGLRIATSLDLGFFEIDADVARNTRAALEIFKSCGATVTEIALPWDVSVIDAGKTHLAHIFSSWMAEASEGQSDLICPYTATWIEQGKAGSAQGFYNALCTAGQMGQDFAAAMAGFDVFICPTTALPAVDAIFDHSQDRLRINGKPVDPVLGWALTVPFNMLSSHPVLSVPSGIARNGCPTGIQIVAKPFRDQDAFDAALAYEAELGGFGQIIPKPDWHAEQNQAAAGNDLHTSK